MKIFKKLIFMSVALGSLQIYSSENFEETQDPILFEIDESQDEQAIIGVLKNLERSNPEVIERIILEEMKLEATFDSVKNFVRQKNKEIELLLKDKNVQDIEVARLAIELAHAQVLYAKAIAEHKAKHKKSHKFEQNIKDALTKAEQALVKLNIQVQQSFGQIVKSAQKTLKNLKIKNSSKKINPIIIEPMDDELMIMTMDEEIA